METRGIRTRVANACDICKVRKIKCSGATPCGYCVRRRQPENCRYTATRRRPRPRPDDIANVATARDRASSSPAASAPSTRTNSRPELSSNPAQSNPTSITADSATTTGISPVVRIAGPSRPATRDRPQLPRDAALGALEEHEETEVPRDARLLCDAQGKLIFIGDCAPLSFFQTVRRLVTSRVDAHAFAPETSGYSTLENVFSRPSASGSYGAKPPPVKVPIRPTVSAYFEVTTGLFDLFDNARLADDLSAWTEHQLRPPDKALDVGSAVNYLVLAIGCQKSDESTAELYFDYARQLAFASLSGDLGVSSVQAFMLISFYSLGACQINAAFLFFGIAARAAYSIGIHRTAVNARFDPEIHRQRDRLWKSLRVLDLFLSTSMGRPPATSDVDCTVPYRAQDQAGNEKFDLLNASAQIFLVIESIVLEVYSRRKISPRLTEGISRELRDWSTRWLQRLKSVIDETSSEHQPGMINGACQILSSYYYAVILVSRPFLMVELHRRLSGEYSLAAPTGLTTGKAKLADACIDAAILMVGAVQDLTERGLMTRRAPVIVSWLFASSLVLGVGLLGGFGRIIEKHCRASIRALEYFALSDAHAVQYSLIAKSLLRTALEHLERKEMQERLQRTEVSSQLFGLIPHACLRTSAGRGDRKLSEDDHDAASSDGSASKGPSRTDNARLEQASGPRFNFDFESAFLGLTEAFPRTPDFSFSGNSLNPDADQTFGAMNLFPLLETDGHIDLASYF